ncbi:MAG: site-specific DNA-methyltransferase [Leptospiraceae bacterium]|nr:site-specific DNA-methyltransferase [Leptospiraceae bacterium]MCK6381630.1 site-specific DNA-methyltransferase [Leptospiraceae bacterium]NUM40811.1 site-specific DNA-methyltransferase [Leptospiraceae bacterium]
MNQNSNYINKIIHGNCVNVVKNIESDSIHLILSDIPYGIGADDWDVLHDNTNSAFLGSSPAQEKAGAIFKKRGKPLNGWSEADRQIPKQYYEWCLTWVGDWLRVLKPGGSAIVFAGRRLAHRCICAFEDTGFTYKDMLAWSKEKAAHRAQRLSVVYEKRGDNDSAEKWDGWKVGNLRPTYEPILWFTKPYQIGGTIADNMLENEVGAYNEKAFLKYNINPNNIINISSNGSDTGLHPTQKPLKLMQALIELTTKENQIVLDPFCGSGTTIIAASSLERDYIGIELDENYYNNATDRLNKFKQANENNLFSSIR